MSLTVQQRKYLKGFAHGLKPVVTVGQHGASESVLKEIEQTINHHELIKIKLPAGEKSMREALTARICEHTKASPVNLIGRTVVIFLQAKQSRFTLPK